MGGNLDWKEFLKPDWRKIVAFVIILSTFFLNAYLDSLRNSELDLPTRIFHIFIFFIWFFIGFIPDIFGKCIVQGGDYFVWCSPYHEYFYYLWDIVVTYLISCFIFWAYDRLKKKTEKKTKSKQA